VNWDNTKSLYIPNDVTKTARKKGKLFLVKGIDYFFIARNAFPWNFIPDMVIARFGYDNFVVATAIANNVSVVDATKTLLAVHQTDVEGNFAGRENTRHTHINTDIIFNLIENEPRIYLHRGYTSSAQYETIYVRRKSDDTVNVMVIKRTKFFKLRRTKQKNETIQHIMKQNTL